MCRLILMLLLAGVLILGTAIFLLFYLLPWPAALPLTLLLLFLTPFAVKFLAVRLAKRFMGNLLTGMVDAKSRVLRNARAEVHAVRRTDPPPRAAHAVESVDDTGGGGIEVLTPHRYVLVDVTITPAASRGGMSHWEPSELVLVPFDQEVRPADVLSGQDDDAPQYPAEDVQLVQHGQPAADDIGKHQGAVRLHLVFALPPDAPRRLKFRYYLETFGEVKVPS